MAEDSIDLKNYDFVELKTYDVHGYTKGRRVARSMLPTVLERGTGLLGATCYCGVKGQLNLHPDLLDAMGFANVRLMPLLDTLRPVQRAVRGHRRIASILCELRRSDGSLETSSPREATLAVLNQLESEFGLKVRSSFEAEFGIRDSKTDQPLAHVNKWGSLTALQMGEDVLMGLIDAMKEVGVNVDTLQSECGPGQFEVTFDVAEGIEAADMATEFKVSSYVYLKTRGYDTEFMTYPDPNVGCSNAYHFNFSLWDKDGRNVFVDPEDDTRLSQFGRHWLAGMVEHAPALTALCSPTINCYRRIGSFWDPAFANWAAENRYAAFRLKIEPGANVYIENRLPGSACNPHLVLASTLAAGMDGVRRKLALPESLDESTRLPATLEEALVALEEDTLLKEALGPKMVELFIYTKRTFEVEEFKAFGELSKEELLSKEKEYYNEPF